MSSQSTPGMDHAERLERWHRQPIKACSSRTPHLSVSGWVVRRRHGLRLWLLAAVVRSNASLAFAAERQDVGETARVATMKDVTARLGSYRECVRHLWNGYFLPAVASSSDKWAV